MRQGGGASRWVDTEEMCGDVSLCRERLPGKLLLEFAKHVCVQLLVERPQFEPESLTLLHKRVRLVPRPPVRAIVRVVCTAAAAQTVNEPISAALIKMHAGLRLVRTILSL